MLHDFDTLVTEELQHLTKIWIDSPPNFQESKWDVGFSATDKICNSISEARRAVPFCEQSALSAEATFGMWIAKYTRPCEGKLSQAMNAT